MPEKAYSKELMQAMQRPLIKHSRMHPEMQAEVVDIMIAAVDKFTDDRGPNTELATRLVKETLDRQYGGPWHCIIGEGFSFDITAQLDSAEKVLNSKRQVSACRIFVNHLQRLDLSFLHGSVGDLSFVSLDCPAPEEVTD